MHSSPRAGAVTKQGGQRRVSMKISDAPVASKAGKIQQTAGFFLFFCGGFEYERIVVGIVSAIPFVQLSTYALVNCTNCTTYSELIRYNYRS